MTLQIAVTTLQALNEMLERHVDNETQVKLWEALEDCALELQKAARNYGLRYQIASAVAGGISALHRNMTDKAVAALSSSLGALADPRCDEGDVAQCNTLWADATIGRRP